jgi:hypothetical protein
MAPRGKALHMDEGGAFGSTGGYQLLKFTTPRAWAGVCAPSSEYCRKLHKNIEVPGVADVAVIGHGITTDDQTPMRGIAINLAFI